jgi:exopolysaccharide biosynthesis polyprenyl glycosylphosphotransferase
LLITDVIVVTVAVYGAQLLWVRVRSMIAGEPVPADGAQPYATLYSIAIIVAWLVFLGLFGTRDRRAFGLGFAEYRRVVNASLATFGGLAIVVYLFNLQLARGYFFIALPAGLAALLLARRLWRGWLCERRRVGDYTSRVLLVGCAETVTQFARVLASKPEAGYRVIGVCVPVGQENATEMSPGIPVTGGFERVLRMIDQTDADTVIVTSADELPPERVRELSWRLEPGRQHLIVAPAITDIGGPRIHTRPVAGLPLVHVETPRYSGGRIQWKRLFDIVVAGALVTVLAPVFLGIAVAIAVTDPGPVLFRQSRIGKGGRTFSMLKFRSMGVDAEARRAEILANADAGNGVLLKMRDDPRVTPIGRILRRYSLDELPQLFNVLAGEMSLIGPRPPLAEEVEEYERRMHRRFLVKPGVTGLWQVNGRSMLSWEESVRLDLYYVENWTLFGDLMILFRTARAVIARKGAF